jgi:hypothetical protein
VTYEIAEQSDVVPIADGDDGNPGLTYFGQFVYGRQGKLGIGKIDNKDAGRALSSELFDGFRDASDLDGCMGNHQVGNDLIDYSPRLVVLDECSKMATIFA